MSFAELKEIKCTFMEKKSCKEKLDWYIRFSWQMEASTIHQGSNKRTRQVNLGSAKLKEMCFIVKTKMGQKLQNSW